MARPSLREKLASSAVDTLHAKGFHGCSIQDITDAAGVPKGSFFNHFESKEALAIDALGRYLQNNRNPQNRTTAGCFIFFVQIGRRQTVTIAGEPDKRGKAAISTARLSRG